MLIREGLSMTAMLYQVTATAAEMCMPVPAAAQGGWPDLVDHWQTLIGAAVGGLLGVAGAWIVAGAARSRERRVAAGMVLPDLQQLTAAGQGVERGVDSDAVGDAAHAKDREARRAAAVVEKLRRRRPNLFALHTPAIGQLSDIDPRLYSHLFQCQMTHRAFEDGMAERRVAREGNSTGRDYGLARMVLLGTSDKRLYDDWRLCVEHATLATYYLDRFVFSRSSRLPQLQRLRMRHFPNDMDLRSKALLETGALPKSGEIQTLQRPAGV
ncbi:hypothetical protein [Burkholderia gladioli]|uniref:hypothetical protein n=1 Tax=Burkholderia gladioli TaxID=28095 RepID=UPI001FC81B88|nr:hypothetical protein [Burkholderia gladioli]